MTPAPALGGPSFWWDQIGLPPRRPPLRGTVQADVAIIGAGYTGLWTAWHLLRAQPSLRVVLIDKHFAGFGASGRNGGWLTGGFPWNHDRYAATHGEQATRAFVHALMGTVDGIIAAVTAEGIEADIHRTDELLVALNPAQLTRLTIEATHRAHWGEDGRIDMLTAKETAQRIAIPGTLGALRVANTARIHPAKLVRGLAQAVERHGATIFEGTPALTIAPGTLTTPQGRITAPIILRTTEGFTATLPNHRRDWLPLNSAQIITEPLSPNQWAEIGWNNAEILGDGSHLYCYCQRTADDRIAVGARGTPYKFASRLDKNGIPDTATVEHLKTILHRLFPTVRNTPLAHAWCGTLAAPRDWCATVGLNDDGMGWAGGYTGVGVSSSFLAGQTLADLTLGQDTDRTRLPWVNRRPRKWEPEPLRWLGVRALYKAYAHADTTENRGGGPSKLAALANRLIGKS